MQFFLTAAPHSTQFNDYLSHLHQPPSYTQFSAFSSSSSSSLYNLLYSIASPAFSASPTNRNKMLVLKLLSIVGMTSAFVFLTLAIASGLYFISEQVEEHTVTTKKILTRLIYSIIAIHILLLIFDGFPWKQTIFSISANVVYLKNLDRFPFIQLSSGSFVTACICVVLNHWFWFRWFTNVDVPPYAILDKNPYYNGPTHPPFAQVSSFLGICVWLIPFALFISLSASDNVLPTTVSSSNDEESAAEKAKRRGTGLAKSIIHFCYQQIVKISQAVGYDLDRSALLP